MSAVDAPPSTPDYQGMGSNPRSGVSGAADESTAVSPMPPPPPFNTPSSGGAGSKDALVAVGTSKGAGEVSGAALADVITGDPSLSGMMSGLSVTAGAGLVDEDDGGDDDNDDDDEEDDDDDEDDEGIDLPPEVMKRLYELKALQSKKDVVYDRYKVERAELESRFAAEYGAIYSQRADVVAGRGTNADASQPAGPADDEVEETGVPHFWMQCMLHHDALHDVVCELDLEALYYLSDVRCKDKENLLGFTLEFHFDDNPYFSNAVLTKRYDTANIMDQGEPLLEGVDGTVIEWKTGRNLCEKSTRTKVKRGGSRSGETKMVTRTEKTDSFFKFFQNPVMYHSEDDVDEEYNFSFDMDYEVARIFRNHLIPNAVLWFTGEAISDDDDEDGDEDDDDDDDDELEEGLDETEGLSDEEGAARAVEGISDGEESEEETNAGEGTKWKALNFQAPTGFGAPTSGSITSQAYKPS